MFSYTFFFLNRTSYNSGFCFCCFTNNKKDSTKQNKKNKTITHKQLFNLISNALHASINTRPVNKVRTDISHRTILIDLWTEDKLQKQLFVLFKKENKLWNLFPKLIYIYAKSHVTKKISA